MVVTIPAVKPGGYRCIVRKVFLPDTAAWAVKVRQALCVAHSFIVCYPTHRSCVNAAIQVAWDNFEEGQFLVRARKTVTRCCVPVYAHVAAQPVIFMVYENVVVIDPARNKSCK